MSNEQTINEKITHETGLVTVREAAEILGVIPRRVRQFIEEDRIPADKLGHQWFLRREDVLVFASKERPVGRPPEGRNAASIEIPDREDQSEDDD